MSVTKKHGTDVQVNISVQDEDGSTVSNSAFSSVEIKTYDQDNTLLRTYTTAQDEETGKLYEPNSSSWRIYVETRDSASVSKVRVEFNGDISETELYDNLWDISGDVETIVYE